MQVVTRHYLHRYGGKKVAILISGFVVDALDGADQFLGTLKRPLL